MGAAAEPHGFRERLAEGRTLVGTLITLPGCAWAELVAGSFDYVCVDLEHAALGAGDLQDAVIGAQAAGAAALARIPAGSTLLTPSLDCGVDGIVAPMIEHAEGARAYVDLMRYPQAGSRGFGPRRSRWGAAAQADPVLIAQIETRAGVEQAPEIAAVDGVDGLLVGTSDLSYDLGAPLDLEDERLRASVAAVRDAAHAAGCAFGLAGRVEPESLGQDLRGAASLVAISTDAAICATALDGTAAAWRMDVTPR
jgi:4-hydroxy-2-oxoheptanedioate aldolase